MALRARVLLVALMVQVLVPVSGVAPTPALAGKSPPASGVVWDWGADASGQLGDGTSGNKNCDCLTTPVEVLGSGGSGNLSGITAVAGGGVHSLALATDQTVWAWGDNTYGELGTSTSATCFNGTTYYPCSTTPVQVAGLGGVQATSAGAGFSLALKNDGTVWAWGENGYGELGNGSTTNSATPEQVSGLTNVIAIAAGPIGQDALALKSDGTVWAWGRNDYGQLGASSSETCYSGTPCSTTPLQVGGLSGVRFVAAGEFHSLALKNDGTVWAWGENTFGELGNNTLTDSSSPVQVAGGGGSGSISGIVAISAGQYHSVALKNDGTVWAWGNDTHGETGQGSAPWCGVSPTAPCDKYPVEVSGAGGTGYFSGATAISAGYEHTLALKGDGSVWAWGDGFWGELGDNNESNSSSPVQVLGSGGRGYLTGMTVIAAGSKHSLAAPALPAQAAPTNTQYNDAPYAGTSGGFVQTYTGAFSYTYSHTDVAIAGRGPSPGFVRSYNSNDTRVGPLGVGWTDNYAMHLAGPGDGTGDLILVGPEGRSDRYTLSGSVFTPPPAVHTTLVRNNDGTYTATAKDQTTWTFNGAGHLIAIADRYGNRSVLSYNASGQLVAVSDPAGRGLLSFAYNGGGQLTSVTDWLSPARSVQFGYDTSGRLQSVTDRAGKATTYGYDASNRLTTITDANNHTQITNTYDSSGRVQTQTDALNNQTSYSYGTDTTTITYPTTSLDPSWHPVVTDTYDTSGRLIKRVSQPTSTETDTEQFAYDASFNLTSHTDARGNTTAYCYDVDYTGAAISPAAGNLTRVIAPAPASGGNVLVTLTKYDAKNNVLETVAPKGVASGTGAACSTNFGSAVNANYATDNAYDSNGVELLSVTRHFTDPDLGLQTAVTKYEYGDSANPGLVTRVIPPRGNTGPTPDYSYATTNTYYGPGSQAGMLDTTADALGHTASYTYDAVGRRLTMVDPDNGTWTYSYDNEDRLLSAATPAVNGTPLSTQFQYDPVGNRSVVIDANGQVTKSLFDARNSLSEVDQSPNPWTDPNATPNPKYATAYAYDNLGNLTRVTRDQGDSANERATDYLYDGAGHLRKEVQYPNWPSTTTQLVTSMAFDGDGNETSMVSPLNQTTTLGYDVDNRLTSLTYSDGVTPNVSLAYDANGDRLSMADGTGTTTYAYDELNRLTSVTSPSSVTVGWRYDLDGNRTKLIYPDGTAVVSAFDKAGRLATTTDWASRTASYGYFNDGHLQAITNVDGTTAALTEDPAQRLTQVTNQQGSTIIDQHSYTLDGVGNRTQRTETLAQVGGGQPVTATTSYSLDRLNRLTADGTAESFTYDPVGNRLTLTEGSQQTAYTYDRADRITSAGTTTYTVDADGNVTARGNDSFAYDQANRLKTATVGGATTTAVYNGDGLRVSQTAGGATTSYVYDTDGALPLLLTDGNRKYVYGPQGLAYSVDAANNVAVYHTDGLGSVRALTDGSGTLIQTYQTDAFGVPTASQGTSTQPFGFTGQQQDGDGLVFLRARYYDPATGRFLSRDTYGGDGTDPLSENRYVYAEDNPSLETDPSGQCPVCVIVAPVVVPVVIEGEQIIGEYGPEAVDTIHQGIQWLQQHAGQQPATSAPVRSPGPSATTTPGSSGPYVLPVAARRVSGRFPPTAGPNETLYRVDPTTGALTFYEVYDSNGLPIKRVDLVGPAHGGIPTPHVQEYVQNVAPDGTVYVNTGSVRPARPDEIP